MANILILGGGFGGLIAVEKLAARIPFILTTGFGMTNYIVSKKERRGRRFIFNSERVSALNSKRE